MPAGRFVRAEPLFGPEPWLPKVISRFASAPAVARISRPAFGWERWRERSGNYFWHAQKLARCSGIRGRRTQSSESKSGDLRPKTLTRAKQIGFSGRRTTSLDKKFGEIPPRTSSFDKKFGRTSPRTSSSGKKFGETTRRPSSSGKKFGISGRRTSAFDHASNDVRDV